MPEPSPADLTYDLRLLECSRNKWRSSAGLRLVYGAIFRAMASRMADGPSLELGSGIGNIKEHIGGVTTSDLVPTPFVDIACSAYAIPPPATDSGEPLWGNLLALDVLHHLCRPLEFFRSAAAVLRPGGRIILVEPAATPWGRVFYSLFHPEPIRPGTIRPPFEMAPDDPSGAFANMGMGVALFKRHRPALAQRLAEWGLEIGEVCFRDLFAYPLTGGYAQPQLAPTGLLRLLLRLEAALPQWLLGQLALRMIMVIRKIPAARNPAGPPT